MPALAIRVENLSKRYHIGERERYRTLRDMIAESVHAPGRRLRRLIQRSNDGDPEEDSIWALRDVSFEVGQSEVVGIIGRNGAGKSTLLKILSRITEPTEGFAVVYGRAGSLLEVGVGFHPELTGRENVYLNGAILGMRRQEIDRRFDEIVAFAELERFIDTPVKRFSSGMYVRLAFAVAAHLESDILLVDEVLSVGDAAFQKKCLRKMGAVTESGRTILFISHQMNSIRKLCTRCMWLDAGRIRAEGPTVSVVGEYEASLAELSVNGARAAGRAPAAARFLGWEIVQPKAEQRNVLATLGQVIFKVVLQTTRPIPDGIHGIALWNSDNQLIWAWATYRLRLDPGVHEFLYELPSLPLRPGVYSWQVSLSSDGEVLDMWHCVPELIVATPPLTHPRDEWSGILNIPCSFQFLSVRDV